MWLVTGGRRAPAVLQPPKSALMQVRSRAAWVASPVASSHPEAREGADRHEGGISEPIGRPLFGLLPLEGS